MTTITGRSLVHRRRTRRAAALTVRHRRTLVGSGDHRELALWSAVRHADTLRR